MWVKGVVCGFADAYVDDKRGRTSLWRAVCGVGFVAAVQPGDRLVWVLLVRLGLLVKVQALIPLGWQAARPSRVVRQ